MKQFKWDSIGHYLDVTIRKNDSCINNWKHIFEISVLNPNEILEETHMMRVIEPLQGMKLQYG